MHFSDPRRAFLKSVDREMAANLFLRQVESGKPP